MKKNSIFISIAVCIMVCSVFMSAGFADRKPVDSKAPLPVLNWEPRSDWLNVKDFGAQGDGKADDTEAVQAALDKVDNGGTVYLPAGVYKITKTLLLARPKRMIGVMVVGHGRDTILVWAGDEGGEMFSPDGVSNSLFQGLVFDGRCKAAVGFVNRNRFFETESEHRHLAFFNFTDTGFLVHPKRKQAVAEPVFYNCYFENNRRGMAFTRHNDYNFVISHCEFRDNDIGIECVNGQFLLRNTHFEGNSVIDVFAKPHHASSARRCTSVGSRAFLDFSGAAAPMAVQDVHVDKWSDTNGVVRLHGAPVTMFDCSFSGGPEGVAPVNIQSANQRLISSNNRVSGNAGLVRKPESARIYEVPAGKRGPVIKSAEQSFILEKVDLPGKVFDVKRDFEAKGDGRTDDTRALQAAIDAAREHGKGAIAYLPRGRYRITETLRITGSDYYVGGAASGQQCGLIWAGEQDGVILEIHNPVNVTLEHIAVGHHNLGKMNNAVDILHTSDSGNSYMIYDGVWTYGIYQSEPERKGFLFKGLNKGDRVFIRHAQGNIRVKDCAPAVILANVAHEGSLTVEGEKRNDGDGMFGIMVRLSTIVTHAVYARDNASLIMSDCYNEQSSGMFRFSGSAKLPPGRITWTGGRSHLSDKAVDSVMDINDYHGEIFIGGKDFSDYRWAEDAPDRALTHTGEAKTSVCLFGNIFYGCNIKKQGGENLHVSMIGNSIYPHEAWQRVVEPEDNFTDADLLSLAGAFDDLRLLGEWDLKFNLSE